ncbi:unnamed protein product [Caenorhabditis bovis]|uniref:Uncharacterized protein n=1 Tax=Caenorhabditis bovis TaxID=2654633 RepID=A0A8S1F401_9PELO|nr:unnamed protein product [Caenorhabditis bovis]
MFSFSDDEAADIFGTNQQVLPQILDVTEEEKKDVLRVPKLQLNGFLSAEKTPIRCPKNRRERRYSRTCGAPTRRQCQSVEIIFASTTQSNCIWFTIPPKLKVRSESSSYLIA